MEHGWWREGFAQNPHLSAGIGGLLSPGLAKAEDTPSVNSGARHGLLKGNFTECPGPLLLWPVSQTHGVGGAAGVKSRRQEK